MDHQNLLPRQNLNFWAINPRVFIIATVSFLILLVSSILRHELFNSSGDLAFFDQSIYLISQGEIPISSTLGFHALADHAAWILYFIAILYKIYPSVYWLFIIQSVALSLGTIPIYLLSIQAGLSSRTALMVVAIYLLFPVIYNSNLCDFHPDTITVVAFLTAILAARCKKPIWFCLSILVILGCKSVLSLTVAAMGIWLILFEKRNLYGYIATISGISWFLIATKIIIPYFGQESALVERHFYRYSYLGNSFPEMLSILSSQPRVILENIFSTINLEYLLLLLVPIIWSLRPKYLNPLVAAFPCIAINILADHISQKNVILHYSLPAIPFLILIAIHSLRQLKPLLKQQHWILVWSFLCFLALGKFWFFTSNRFLGNFDNLRETRAAINLIQPETSVLTTDIITPHLTHRKLINFTLNENQDIQDFDNVLINLRHPGWGASLQYYQDIVTSLQNDSAFTLQLQKNDVYLFSKKS